MLRVPRLTFAAFGILLFHRMTAKQHLQAWVSKVLNGRIIDCEERRLSLWTQSVDR
jgi:hypothetical protein